MVMISITMMMMMTMMMMIMIINNSFSSNGSSKNTCQLGARCVWSKFELARHIALLRS